MLRIKDLTKIYKSKNKKTCKALDNVSINFPSSGLVYVIGKSGSGKSTLLNLIGGLDNVSAGSIEFDDLDIAKANERELYTYRASNIGFIFQDFHLIDCLTIKENINLSLKFLNIEDDYKIEDVLKKVDLEDCLEKYPTEMSGGQKQRVAIARALVKDPDIILADEPTGNLDSNTTKQITNILKEIAKEKLVIIVSHNLYDAYEYADRIIELSEGKVINDLTRNEDYSNEISIKQNTLFIPLLKRFDTKELDYIYDVLSNKKVGFLRQKVDKFTSTVDTCYESKKYTKKQIVFPFKDTIKLSFLFIKNNIIKFLFSSIISAAILVVLYLCQSIAYFQPADVIKDIMQEDFSSFGIRKNIDYSKMETGIEAISDEEIDEIIERGYNGEVYKLYPISFPLSYYFTISELRIPDMRICSIYPNETTGVLVTDEEYVKDILHLDEIEVYQDSSIYSDGGVYITDYVADAILNAKYISGFYHSINTYDDILGNLYVQTPNVSNCHGFINGIIKTNYKEEFEDIFNLIKDKIKNNDSTLTDEIIEYYDYVCNSYALTFSFNPYFIDYYNENNYCRNYNYIYEYSLDENVALSKLTNVTVGSSKNIFLEDDEIVLNYNDYNTAYGTSYDESNYHTFVPHKAKLTLSGDSDLERIFEKEVTIKSIKLPDSTTVMLLSDKLFKEFKTHNTFAYGLYFDDNNTLNNVINNLDQDKYVIMSNKMAAINTMNKAVKAFNEFFDLIVFIIMGALIFMLISFGIKNVNHKIYEIGILKALGCKASKLSLIFGLHTIVLILFIWIISLTGVVLTYDFANTVLVESLKVLAPTHTILNLRYIRFDINLIIINSLIVLAISLISTFVSILKLKSIKPILIIKAKE